MSPDEPFSPAHAEREIDRLFKPATSTSWLAPNGERFKLTIPPTVYPPREDTDLLASLLGEQLLTPGARWMEIGCGSGALSLVAARFGCVVTACDVNPLSVACTRAHFKRYGLEAAVFEGGPGPVEDGGAGQWGGLDTYDVVVWNTPYLGVNALEDGTLGPMEEAALTDTDAVGLYARFIKLLANGELLAPEGVAYLTVSSKGGGETACETAWASGIAARRVASTMFEDGEVLSVIALWNPYRHAPVFHLAEIDSTNTELLRQGGAGGTTLRADVQHHGRGRHGRTWTSYSGALLASWLLSSGSDLSHATMDQLRVGVSLGRLVRQISNASEDDVALKWPNDLYLRSNDNLMKKVAGVLFEAVSQGEEHRVVLGIGINRLAGSPEHAGLDEHGSTVNIEGLHHAVHAMVASLFEPHVKVPLPVVSESGVLKALQAGERLLGPLFYRKEPTSIAGVDDTGALHLEGMSDPVDEPDDLVYSGI